MDKDVLAIVKNPDVIYFSDHEVLCRVIEEEEEGEENFQDI